MKIHRTLRSNVLFRSIIFALLLLGQMQQAQAQPAAKGTISGVISSSESGRTLEGARVELPDSGRTALTDQNGRFSLLDIPPGEHRVVASYIGFEEQKMTVHVSPGSESALGLRLISSDVLVLENFTVVSEREGNAASLTAQRNAANVKNVVSLDAYGNLPNDSVGELAMRLPGVAGIVDTQETVTAVAIRGIPPGLNGGTIDGNPMASSAGLARDFRTLNLSSALFGEIEVVKGFTPEMVADGLGGGINLKTRSPLNLKGKRQFQYRADVRWAPEFYNHIPVRHDKPAHPLLSLGYQEVFDVLGGKRNLGISLSAFASDNVSGFSMGQRVYAYTTASPAFLWDYRENNVLVDRNQRSIGGKVEWQVNENTKLHLNSFLVGGGTRYRRDNIFRAVTNQVVGTTSTAGIEPGYTDTLTTVRPVAASTVQLTSRDTPNNFIDHTFQLELGAEHKFGRWKIDYTGNINQSDVDGPNGIGGEQKGGTFISSITKVGWTVDSSASIINPVFTQTAGPSIYDAANYTSGRMDWANAYERNSENMTLKANVSYELPTELRTVLKTGINFRTFRSGEVQDVSRYTYIGSAQSLASLAVARAPTSFEVWSGTTLPFADAKTVYNNIQGHPENWKQDRYYEEVTRLRGTREVQESVSAGYLQARIDMRKLHVVGGARFERTEVESTGNIASKTLTTTAQRTADPVGSANLDYNNPRNLKGSFSDLFPSVQTVYRFTPKFQSHIGWSQTIGRPNMTNYLPLETANDTTQTVSINNASLKPQHSNNYDLSLEYYFKPAGQISVGYFHKDITGFIFRDNAGVVGEGLDNGFGGKYEGYTITTNQNGGTAKIDGLEFNYQQQLSFLPGALKGLGFFANYTRLWTKGDYGVDGPRVTDEVEDFIPETANLGVFWKYRGVGARILVSRISGYLLTYSSDPSRLEYEVDRTTVNIGLSYQYRPWLSFSVDITNAFNEPKTWYRSVPNRVSLYSVNGTLINFGVSGRF